LSSLSVTGNIATSGNFVGNGAALTGIIATAANSAVYLRDASNAAVNMSISAAGSAVLLPGGGAISYSGNGDANTIGSIDIVNPQANLANAYTALTFINTANFAANPVNTVFVSNDTVFIGYDVGGTAQTINVDSGGVTTNTTFSATGTVTGGNLNTGGAVSATGNITGANINGNGSGLSSITAANVTGTVANATYATSAGSATTAGTVTTAAQANITSVGILTSLSSSGNITGANINGNGSGLTSLPGANVSGAVANATYAVSAGTAGTVTTAAQANITSVGTLTSLSVTANVQAGNLRTAGQISATGNITGNYFIGNGSQLTGIASSGSSAGLENIFMLGGM